MSEPFGRTQHVLRLVLLLMALAAPASAAEFDQDLSFNQVGINPWDGQPSTAFDFDQSVGLSFSATIPPTGLSAGDLLKQFLGIDASILSVELGGNVSGSAGLDFGVHVDPGRLAVSYPGLASLNVATTGVIGGTNVVNSLGFSIGSGFAPGVSQTFTPTRTPMIQLAGAGYGDTSAGFAFDSFSQPTFATNFPNATAHADANLNVDLKAQIKTTGIDIPLVGCLGCTTTDIDVGSHNATIPIVEIDPNNIYIAGVGGSRLDTPQHVGPLTVTPSFPNLQVASQPLAPGATTLTGQGQKPIITVDGSLDSLVPGVGALLQGGVGPFGYNLASVNGGLGLALKQTMSLDVDPTVTLQFSTPVRVSIDGAPAATEMSATYKLGQTVDVRPIIGGQDKLTIHPTYALNGTFDNLTDLSLIANLTLQGPELTSPFGNVGPVGADNETFDLADFGLFHSNFQLDAGTIDAPNIELDLSAGLPPGLVALQDLVGRVVMTNADDVGPGQEPGTEHFHLTFKDEDTGFTFEVDRDGTLSELSRGERVFSTLDDVSFTEPFSCGSLCDTPRQIDVPIDLGDAFCVFCIDASNSPDFLALSPLFEQNGQDLLFNELADLPAPLCTTCDQLLTQQNEQFGGIGPVVTVDRVPEPPTLPLFALALFFIAAPGGWRAARRRARARFDTAGRLHGLSG